MPAPFPRQPDMWPFLPFRKSLPGCPCRVARLAAAEQPDPHTVAQGIAGLD